jgi:hypothetical protein
MCGLGVLLPLVSSPLRRLLHVSTLILGTAIEMPHRGVGRLGLRTLPYQITPPSLEGPWVPRHPVVADEVCSRSPRRVYILVEVETNEAVLCGRSRSE